VLNPVRKGGRALVEKVVGGDRETIRMAVGGKSEQGLPACVALVYLERDVVEGLGGYHTQGCPVRSGGPEKPADGARESCLAGAVGADDNIHARRKVRENGASPWKARHGDDPNASKLQRRAPVREALPAVRGPRSILRSRVP